MRVLLKFPSWEELRKIKDIRKGFQLVAWKTDHLYFFIKKTDCLGTSTFVYQRIEDVCPKLGLSWWFDSKWIYLECRRCRRWVQYLGLENPLEVGMAIHPSILAWRISLTEKPGRLQSIGLQITIHDWSDLECVHAHPKLWKYIWVEKTIWKSSGFGQWLKSKELIGLCMKNKSYEKNAEASIQLWQMLKGRGDCQGPEGKENIDNIFSQKSRQRTVSREKTLLTVSNAAERLSKDRDIVAFGLWLIWRSSCYKYCWNK